MSVKIEVRTTENLDNRAMTVSQLAKTGVNKTQLRKVKGQGNMSSIGPYTCNLMKKWRKCLRK